MNRDEFGKGAVDGIIAPESANNATAGGALIMMMALGIPGDIVTAVMLGALMIHNVIPGPSFIQDEPYASLWYFYSLFCSSFFYAWIASIFIKDVFACYESSNVRVSLYNISVLRNRCILTS